ncbi:MAG: ABC transporter ATP-binding protein [Planctomycetes bacterium]|nr:ABC transporter ATP-binding protein [Planctomycetota bacterium]
MAEVARVIFRARGLTKRYGGITAVSGVDMELAPGDLVGLIGPNGAGKTTCFNLITGADAPTAGTIAFKGEDVTGARDFEMARRGIARTFQNIRLWKEMSVLDNVRAVCRAEESCGFGSAVLRLPRFRRVERAVTGKATALLERLGLGDVLPESPGDLPYGDQRRLEIARALALDPDLLLLDEPAAGMNPTEKARLMETVKDLRREFDLTILLIDHDMKFVMGICERIYVLDHGERIAHGTPSEIRCDRKVIEAYLGSEC